MRRRETTKIAIEGADDIPGAHGTHKARVTNVLYIAGVVEWLMAPGCKPGRLTSYVGSNPTPCTILEFEISDLKFEIGSCGSNSMVEY